MSCLRKLSLSSGASTACRTSRCNCETIASGVPPGASKMKSVRQVEPGITGFRDRRHVGHKRRTFRRRDRKRAQLTGGDLRKEAGGRTERCLVLAREQIGRHRRRPAIRHRHGLEAGEKPEVFHREMRRRAVAGMAVRHRAFLLGPGDKLGQIVCRHGGMNEHRLGAVVDDADGLQIEGQVLVEVRIDRQRRAQQQQQRVAVRRRLADGVGRDVAARAGPGLDHHRLLQAGGHLLRNRAADDVERPAGRRRHDHPDRLRRIGLRDRSRRRVKRQRPELRAGIATRSGVLRSRVDTAPSAPVRAINIIRDVSDRGKRIDLGCVGTPQADAGDELCGEPLGASSIGATCGAPKWIGNSSDPCSAHDSRSRRRDTAASAGRSSCM